MTTAEAVASQPEGADVLVGTGRLHCHHPYVAADSSRSGLAATRGMDLDTGPCWDDALVEVGQSTEPADHANSDGSTL